MVLVALLFTAGCGGEGSSSASDLAGTIGATGSQRSADAGGDVPVEALLGTHIPLVLTGAEEVPGPGHPAARGTAAVVLVADRKEVCVELSLEGLDRPTGVHLHEAPAGGAGDVVLALPAPAAGDGVVSACVSAPTDLLERLRRTPDRFYVNVHSGSHPDGALRGQLR